MPVRKHAAGPASWPPPDRTASPVAVSPVAETGSRLRRTAARLALAAGSGTLGLLASGWVCAEELLDPARAGDPYTLKVLAVDATSVTLPSTGDTRAPGPCALQWPGGYGLLGALGATTPRGIRRPLSAVVGTPLAAGMRARIRRHLFEGDPDRAFGFSFSELAVPGAFGPLPAWLIPAGTNQSPAGGQGDATRAPGPGDLPWAIAIHGRGHTRVGMLRLLPELRAGGFTTLVVSYRNDPGAPAGPDGLYHLADTEWQDVEAAVREAQMLGARRFILLGDSMGGAIALQFLERSPLGAAVGGLVLDSPVLDWHATLALNARVHHVPPLVAAVAKAIARQRLGLAWERFDQIAKAGALAVPVLLIHGDADQTVPVETSDALASRRPDLVTYRRVRGADHLESWAVDQLGCNTALRAFLARPAVRAPGEAT